MINLYYSASTSTFVMYPDEIPFSASLNPFYRLSLSQSLDNSNSLVTLSRINTRTPKNDSSVLVFQALTGSGIPTASGQYQAQLLYQAEAARGQWGNTHRQYSFIHETWSDVRTGFVSGSVLAEDRAYVFGTNEVDITTNTQTDQIGSYTTYNS